MQTKKYPILYDQSQIKFGRLNSTDDILKMFKLIFNREFKPDIVDWFAACPTGPNKWYAAFKGDEPVAMYGLLPIKVKVGTSAVEAALCNNVGVLPEFQGTGLFQAIGEYALNDSNYPLVIGVPNAKAVKGHKRIGWKSFGILELLSGTAQGKEQSYLPLDQFRYFKPINEVYLRLIKDPAYTKWRYSRPDRIYNQTIFGPEDYVIWKKYDSKIQILELSDYKLLEEFKGVIDVWAFKNTMISDNLKNRGFNPLTTNEFILYTKINVPEDPNEFIFELGDNDVF